MLKQKNGLTRKARKTIAKVKNLKMDLEFINKKAQKIGFSKVKDDYDRIKQELRDAKQAEALLTL